MLYADADSRDKLIQACCPSLGNYKDETETMENQAETRQNQYDKQAWIKLGCLNVKVYSHLVDTVNGHFPMVKSTNGMHIDGEDREPLCVKIFL